MRIQVSVSDEMVSKIDALAKQLGVSRSAFCSVLIGQSVMNFENSMKIITDKLSNERFLHDLVTDLKD